MRRLVGALILLAALAGADTLSVPLGRIACIQSGGYARLLAQFDLSALGESSYVYYAEIVAPCRTAETLAIETRRVTTPWVHETVRWDFPWRKHGGDFDTTRSALFLYIAGRHNSLAMDVTRYVRDWLHLERGSNQGLLFSEGIKRESGFRRYNGLQEALENARIRVIYRAPAKQDKKGAKEPSTAGRTR
jgi:hypothetical protein